MSLISFVLIAAGGWIEFAALCQANFRQAWAYNACASADGLCNYHTPIFYGAMALAVASLLIGWLRNA